MLLAYIASDPFVQAIFLIILGLSCFVPFVSHMWYKGDRAKAAEDFTAYRAQSKERLEEKLADYGYKLRSEGKLIESTAREQNDLQGIGHVEVVDDPIDDDYSEHRY